MTVKLGPSRTILSAFARVPSQAPDRERWEQGQAPAMRTMNSSFLNLAAPPKAARRPGCLGRRCLLFLLAFTSSGAAQIIEPSREVYFGLLGTDFAYSYVSTALEEEVPVGRGWIREGTFVPDLSLEGRFTYYEFRTFWGQEYRGTQFVYHQGRPREFGGFRPYVGIGVGWVTDALQGFQPDTSQPPEDIIFEWRAFRTQYIGDSVYPEQTEFVYHRGNPTVVNGEEAYVVMGPGWVTNAREGFQPDLDRPSEKVIYELRAFQTVYPETNVFPQRAVFVYHHGSPTVINGQEAYVEVGMGWVTNALEGFEPDFSMPSKRVVFERRAMISVYPAMNVFPGETVFVYHHSSPEIINGEEAYVDVGRGWVTNAREGYKRDFSVPSRLVWYESKELKGVPRTLFHHGPADDFDQGRQGLGWVFLPKLAFMPDRPVGDGTIEIGEPFFRPTYGWGASVENIAFEEQNLAVTFQNRSMNLDGSPRRATFDFHVDVYSSKEDVVSRDVRIELAPDGHYVWRIPGGEVFGEDGRYVIAAEAHALGNVQTGGRVTSFGIELAPPASNEEIYFDLVFGSGAFPEDLVFEDQHLVVGFRNRSRNSDGTPRAGTFDLRVYVQSPEGSGFLREERAEIQPDGLLVWRIPGAEAFDKDGRYVVVAQAYVLGGELTGSRKAPIEVVMEPLDVPYAAEFYLIWGWGASVEDIRIESGAILIIYRNRSRQSDGLPRPAIFDLRIVAESPSGGIGASREMRVELKSEETFTWEIPVDDILPEDGRHVLTAEAYLIGGELTGRREVLVELSGDVLTAVQRRVLEAIFFNLAGVKNWLSYP